MSAAGREGNKERQRIRERRVKRRNKPKEKEKEKERKQKENEEEREVVEKQILTPCFIGWNTPTVEYHGDAAGPW